MPCRGYCRQAGSIRHEPFVQLRPSPPPRDVFYRDGDSLLLADQHDQPFAARDAGIEQVPLQHGVVLRHHGDYDCGIFRPLGFVDRGCVSWNEGIEFAEAICDGAPVEAGGELAVVRIDIVDVADVAVIDFLVVVVLDLHDLVARGEGPAEAFDLALAGRIEGRLQLDIE